MTDTPIERLKELLAELSLPLRVECSIYEPMAASIVPADFLAGGNTIAHLSDYQNAVALTEIVNALPALLATIEPIPSAGEGERRIEPEDVDALRYVLNFADSNSRVRTIMKAFTLPARMTVESRLERLYAALATLPSEPLRDD